MANGPSLLSVCEERSTEIRKQICEVMLVDSVNPCNSTIHESQSSMMTHESIDDIENLKTGQLINSESIRSLAQSVSHKTTVISQLHKRNEDIRNNSLKTDLRFAALKFAGGIERRNVRLTKNQSIPYVIRSHCDTCVNHRK